MFKVMEAKINIAEILKNKPQGTKLYNLLYNIDVELDTIVTTGTKTIVWCTDKIDNNNVCHRFYSEFGTIEGHNDGLQILLPSKEMRDWGKFAWKKGDVLISNDGKKEVFFNGFTDDTYALFKAKHGFEVLSNGNAIYLANEDGIATSDYTLEDKDVAQTYINTIEERLGGKLNRETLEIEKTQPEFKDGDIVCISGMGYLAYGIVKSIDYSSKKLEYYVLNDMSTLKFEDWLSFEDKQIQPITETQQIILFDALAKKGKTWDCVKKQIVDLKPKCEFKPFDKVLSRRCSEDYLVLNFYSHKSHKTDYHICIDGSSNLYCIPYNEETAHLLGTTDEWKGGEG
jgi:hypothetical protein